MNVSPAQARDHGFINDRWKSVGVSPYRLIENDHLPHAATSKETRLPKERLEIVEVGAWEAGHHDETGKIVVIFRFRDGEPVAWACDPDIAAEIGEGLLTLAAQARKRKH